MKLAILSLVMCLASLVWAEDPPPVSTSVLLPLGFEDGLGCVKWTNALVMTKTQGIDSFSFVVHPQIEQPPWKLTISCDDYRKPIDPVPDRKREWWPFSQLTTLHIHRDADGSVWAESMVPGGRALEPDEKTGTFKRTGPIQQIHIQLWCATEADLEPTITSLGFTKAPLPKD